MWGRSFHAEMGMVSAIACMLWTHVSFVFCWTCYLALSGASLQTRESSCFLPSIVLNAFLKGIEKRRLVAPLRRGALAALFLFPILYFVGDHSLSWIIATGWAYAAAVLGHFIHSYSLIPFRKALMDIVAPFCALLLGIGVGMVLS